MSGLWSLYSSAFAGYMQEGVNMRDDYVSRRKEDPVWRFWVWRYGVLNSRPKGLPEGRVRRPAGRGGGQG